MDFFQKKYLQGRIHLIIVQILQSILLLQKRLGHLETYGVKREINES